MNASLGTILSDFWDSFYNTFLNGYKRLLSICIRRKKLFILIAIFLFAVSLLTVQLVGYEYFPAMDEGIIEIDVILPKGSNLDETKELVFDIHERIDNIFEIQDIIINLGNDGSVLDRSGSEKARLIVNVGSLDQRNRDIKEITQDIRGKLSGIAGAQIKIKDDSKVMGFSISDNEVEIQISGDDIVVLKKIANDILHDLESINGLTEIESSFEQEIEEISIKTDKNKALLYGLTQIEIGQQIQAKIDGITASRFSYRGSEIDIFVKRSDHEESSIQELKNLTVQSSRGIDIPLSELCEVTIEKSPSDIVRVDQKRTVSISANLYNRALNKVTEDIDKVLQNYRFPQGYSWTYGGQQKDLFDSFDELKNALILSLIIVYMLMAAQFESLLHPITIMLSVPLALTGALMSLFVTGKTLSVPAFIGIIMLSGIVVDNAIVLIDTINQFRKKGKERDDAILTAAPLRLRPILMTTLTTISGMLPMALDKSEGSEILVPLAIVVIGGLTVSTFVTLLFIPSFYAAFDEIIKRVTKKSA
ncbi:MAG: efflux RND transporter permease subunit [Clostridiaceae bacterium]|nr:efflux RND transporter permease subunit [Clostridiaceae bacterium]